MWVDFPVMLSRLRLAHLQERVSSLWISRILTRIRPWDAMGVQVRRRSPCRIYPKDLQSTAVTYPEILVSCKDGLSGSHVPRPSLQYNDSIHD